MKQLALDRQVQEAELALQKEKQDAEIALKTEVARVDSELADKALENEKRIKAETLAFDQKCRAEDMKAEQDDKDEIGVEAVAPKLIESMQAIVKEFADVIKGQQEFQQKLVEQMAKPKTVKLAGIQRNEKGITGALATIQ